MPYIVIIFFLLIAPGFVPGRVQEPTQPPPEPQSEQPKEKSKRPTPSAGKSKSNPPAEKPEQNAQAPESKQEPPEPPVTNPEAPKAEAVPANAPEKRESKTSSDWWIVRLTGALVLVGFCQILAMLAQTYWMGRTVRVAQDGANAANRTATTMQETAERQLRAYVLLTTAQRHRDAQRKDASTIKIKIKNFGVTPAYDFTNWMGVDILPWPLPTDLGRPPNTNENRSMSILGPGDITELGGEMRPLSTESEAQIRRGEYAIVVFGQINYRDAFNIRRVTNFRAFCMGELINDGRFAPHDQGNDAT